MDNMETLTAIHSRETLRRVKENDESLTTLWIGGDVYKSRPLDISASSILRSRMGNYMVMRAFLIQVMTASLLNLANILRGIRI